MPQANGSGPKTYRPQPYHYDVSYTNLTPKNFDLAIEKVFKEIYKADKNLKNNITASFICSMTIYWPSGKNFTSKGIINGKISSIKKVKNGFGYDPILFLMDMKKLLEKWNLS